VRVISLRVVSGARNVLGTADLTHSCRKHDAYERNLNELTQYCSIELALPDLGTCRSCADYGTSRMASTEVRYIRQVCHHGNPSCRQEVVSAAHHGKSYLHRSLEKALVLPDSPTPYWILCALHGTCTVR
jgi:hypothetical protein